MKKTLLLILCAILLLTSEGQVSRIDSLKNLLKTEKIDTVRLKLLVDLVTSFEAISIDSALHYTFESIKLANKVNSYSMQARGKYFAGYILSYTGNLVQSMQLLLQGKAIAQKNNDSILVRQYYFYLGHIYKRQHDYLNATKSYLLCVDGISRTGQPEMNPGIVYLEQDKPDSALFFYTRALEIQTSIKQNRWRAYILAGMGWAHAKLGNASIARGYITTAENERIKMEQPREVQSGYLIISKYFAEFNNIDSSIYYARQALFLKSGQVFKPNLFDAAAFLASLYEGRNTDSAYKFLKMSLSLNKEIMSNEKSQQLQTLRFEDDMEQQKQAQEAGKDKLERKHNLQYAAIALGLVAFLVMFFVFSHSVIANQRLIRFLGILTLLIVFEFINLFIHPYLDKWTDHSIPIMLGVMVCIAALLIPLHHTLEHWITHKLVEKNKKIRLAAAKRTIAKLEGEQTN